MKNESDPNNNWDTSLSSEPQASGPEGQKTQDAADRLERVEAALGLLTDHMQTSAKGSEILEAEHSRSMLASLAFGFSAISLIAMWSIDLVIEDDDVDLMKFTIGMALLLFAAVVDLFSASLLRTAVHNAILEKEPSDLVIWRAARQRVFQIDYWATLKKESPEFYRHRIMRVISMASYIAAGIVLVWAVVTL